jgi:hypothetical protein
MFWLGFVAGIAASIVGAFLVVFLLSFVDERERFGTKSQAEWDAERRARSAADRAPWGRA